MIGAVILAAGAGRRMGACKPLLEIDGRTLIERLVETFRAAGVAEPRVVVAPGADELIRRLAGLRVPAVVNPDPSRGMFSSVRTGVAALPADLDGFFVHPADIPFVRSETLRRLIAALTPGVAVAHPRVAGRRGHPPLLAAEWRPVLLRGADPPDGLRGVLAAAPVGRVAEVPCDDEGARFDLDTPVDWRAAQRPESPLPRTGPAV